MRIEFVRQLMTLAGNDKDVILLTGDLGFGTFENFAETFPKQFFNVGIAEQNMAGVAAGLALSGKKVFAYSIGNFASLRCLEQIRNDICYHDLSVTMVSQGGGYNYGAAGMSHHSTEDLSIMRALPGMQVLAPSCRKSVAALVQELGRRKGPAYLRLEKTIVDSFGDFEYGIGQSVTIREGSDVSFFAIGTVVSEALKAAALLELEGISVQVVDVTSLKPFDTETLLEAANRMSAIVTIEENNVCGGLFGLVAETLCRARSNVILESIAISDRFTSVVGDQNYLRQLNGLLATDIARLTRSVLVKV